MKDTLERMVEVRGKRKSGKSTKLNELFIEALQDNDGFCLIIGTDIRMSDVNEKFGEGLVPDMAIITPSFREVHCIVNGIFARYKLEDFLKIYDDIEEIRLFVDNVTLENSKEVFDELKHHEGIVELYYTTLNKYRREALRNLLDIDKYDLDFETDLLRIFVEAKDGLYFSIEEEIHHGDTI